MAPDTKKSEQQSLVGPAEGTNGSAVLNLFHAPVQDWFSAVFTAPTPPQVMGWPAIARGESTLILAPTGTGKTLAAFLWCIDRIMFAATPRKEQRCRVVYISPIKALAVDVERNLQAPLIGIAQVAQRLGVSFHTPTVAIRTGDTPQSERAAFLRHPSDILITTPESLYLLLTSNARELLRSVEAVIIDEIHALVPSKRGSHLALSIERLEMLVRRGLQRIGLSATQRPLEEVARFLGGVDVARQPEVAEENTSNPQSCKDNQETEAEKVLAEFTSSVGAPVYRPVTIVDAGELKRLDLRVEVPVEDMTRLGKMEEVPKGAASPGATARPSIWSAIHPKLLELVRAHRSTLIFVNNRRLAERISGAINELAGETLVRAHHGSVAVDQRKDIEERLKMGTIRGLVATSSLELGIDMGAIDLVVQIESPPSVASGMQRVGRASHRVDAVSNAVIFPKYRGDLVACAAITRAMYDGLVEPIHFPRNPLDVLAQHIVAMVSVESWSVGDLFKVVCSAAPYGGLTRASFESVLDMLSGRYPSDEFAELRPRLTWDRIGNRLNGREGSKRVAIINGGTIPDRGLYGVFLSGAVKGARVGELDEEMVFESRVGESIVLGATTWHIDEISHDRVFVSPAPGEPGKMPFWKGDGPGRPAEFGRKIGEMTRELLRLPRSVAFRQLMERHSLEANAAENLLHYLEEQAIATRRVPSDEDVVIEICRDELGDRRICVMTPFGSRVHAPWCMAVTAKLRRELGLGVESLWSDDGFVLRIPDSDTLIGSELLLLPPAEFRDLVLQQLGSTSLFAAKFREAAGRALLLPKRRAGLRAPLWQQRKRAADLLAVAARFPSFPILLETYRECIRDVFDLPAASAILSSIQCGEIQATTIESDRPSPFAASLLFSYVANYIYEGDAPLAERRAQALSIDQSQLQEILGDSDLRQLLDSAALDDVQSRLQALEPEYRARHADAVHDLLLRLGDLTAEEITARSSSAEVAGSVNKLVDAGRVVGVRIAGMTRYVPVEYAARYRDALGTPLPPGLTGVFLQHSEDPFGQLIRRYARTHGPFASTEIAARYGVKATDVEGVLHAFHGRGQLLEGEFRPRGTHREWCDPEVLQQIRRKSLTRLRREVEPVEQHTFARFVGHWQGVGVKRRGLDALLDVIESLQGVALPVSELERNILPARLSEYSRADLDMVMAAGEVVWVGVEQIGEHDGRVALYLTESLPLLMPPEELRENDLPLSERAARIQEVLEKQGASFFAQLYAAIGGGFPQETQEALMELVWSGWVTNDTFHPLRNLLHGNETKRTRAQLAGGPPGSPELLRRLRSRTTGGNAAQGRWSLLRRRIGDSSNLTKWSANMAQQLLVRHGIVMRETAIAENIPRGYQSVYPALKLMEDSGWARRGMFVAGLGAAQFAMTAAVDMLRGFRIDPSIPEAVFLAATDPANPYGTLLPWPRDEANGGGTPLHGMSRTAGAGVILINGALTAFLRRRSPSIRVFLPEGESERSQVARELTRKLAELAIRRQGRRSGLLIGEINDGSAREHFLAHFLEEAGFVSTALGFQMRRVTAIALATDAGTREEKESEQEHLESS